MIDYEKKLLTQEKIQGEEYLTLRDLAIQYATNYWAGVWKELLLDTDGNQYGTFDQNGNIYPETLKVLIENGIVPNESWPLQLWNMAGESLLYKNGQLLKQFWTLESATNELLGFTNSTEENGYGGEIMILRDLNNQICGFTAYTVNNNAEESRKLCQKRFPYQQLILPGNNNETEITLEKLLETNFPNKKVGVYLDFAISESQRGQGLGSKLFDARIDRLICLGAEVIVGRTIKTSPAQYYGNYIARNMEPIAYDPSNPDKTMFAVLTTDLMERKTK